MASIYIHIPFCYQACHYCNFHFTVSRKKEKQIIEAMVKEIGMRSNYLKGEQLDTIYFGGGTPSILPIESIAWLLNEVKTHFQIKPQAEITLEANPDDLQTDKATQLAALGFNRLSIGVQSFNDADLVYLNRKHTSQEAINAIENAQKSGINNITIDLIYGIPVSSDVILEENLNRITQLNIPHFSAYCLTVENKTPLEWMIRKGKIQPVNEEQGARQFFFLMQKSVQLGFEHYEISNFAKPLFYSKHNTAYWQGKSYLGIGPCAHSFNGLERHWNTTRNMEYIQCLENNTIAYQGEVLTPQNRFNEFVMTSIRTQWGIDLKVVSDNFPLWKQPFLKGIAVFVQKGWVVQKENTFVLTNSGKLYADLIASDLMIMR